MLKNAMAQEAVATEGVGVNAVGGVPFKRG